MELAEVEIIKKYGERCMQCTRTILLPYENEWTCFSCGSTVIKRENGFTKMQQRTLSIAKNFPKKG